LVAFDLTGRHWFILRRARPVDLHDLTQTDPDQRLSEGTTTRRAVRYFLQTHTHNLIGDLSVPPLRRAGSLW
jgi:hypothetical protein